MISKDKRLFNFRPFVFVALCFMAGIFINSLIFTASQVYSILVMLLIVVVLFVLVLIPSFRELICAHRICVFMCLILFIFSFCATSFRVNEFENREYPDSGVVTATATIYEVKDNKIIVNNVRTDYYSYKQNAYLENAKLKGKITLYVSEMDSDIFQVGNNIEFTTQISFYDIIYKNQFNLNCFVYDIVGQGTVLTEQITKLNTKSSLTPFQYLRKICKEKLNENLDSDIASVAYAMLFGDKSGIDLIYGNFKTSGLAHLLAVSGLHVGFFTVILVGIAKLLKLKNLYKFIFVSSILFLYAWICNFSPSIVRAFIMATVVMFAGVRGKQYDGLNSLSLSAIIILFFNPFYLFNIGFQLSFMAVLFIFLLSPVITRLLSKFLGQHLSSAIAITFSAQIGTLPIIMQIYPTQSAVSIFTNLLAVPIASIGFMGIVIFLFFALIFPSLSFLLVIPEMALSLVVLIATTVAGMETTLVTFLPTQFFVALVIVLGVAISDFIFFKKPVKQICAGFLCIAFLAILGLF